MKNVGKPTPQEIPFRERDHVPGVAPEDRWSEAVLLGNALDGPSVSRGP